MRRHGPHGNPTVPIIIYLLATMKMQAQVHLHARQRCSLIILNQILDPLVRTGSGAILFGSGNIDPRYIRSPVEHEVSNFGGLTTLFCLEENPGDVLHNLFSTLDFFRTCDRLVKYGVISDSAPPDLI